MRIMSDSPSTPELPISTLLSPVLPAPTPAAVLLLPVLLKSALSPLAVLLLPVVLFKSA